MAWTTLTTTDDAGQFTSYLVTVDSVVLVGTLNGPVAAIAVPETVDFAKLTNLSELWATASMPVDTYTSAIITMDYTNAQISVMVNGAPVKVNVVDPSGVTPTTIAVTVYLDPEQRSGAAAHLCDEQRTASRHQLRYVGIEQGRT